ncbi:putative Bardet-Biedl syndrome 4 protein like protein [Monoraphidium neglectum]|uniref:Putative Bardet-Biedl syndrome 4 protein like protein n=1 Tax=Monoraphidium neglectum TaxID=145388 RepID=A0A0D2M4P4_9CHLO|nr:putative Bardet-Biedl syndrome 4 protein like protein [Monoraphidium neglectum]KIY96256.1 putative Bardet-Biedl syndrome 4 protein like protein [Monoraphidium neglectum]|eukprot:XP_013895276.1 putative Bardet-Biedl syndrome 4 protein like protein [Monoraphidium neglectum]
MKRCNATTATADAVADTAAWRIQESLRLFQQATALNPHNVLNLKQVGRSLALLGKHRQAVDVYQEAQKLSPDDWELWYSRGLCLSHLKDQQDSALECFGCANAIQPNDGTYIQIGQILAARDQLSAAIDNYGEALQQSPESPELLTALGLLLLRAGDSQRAFDQLGASLLHEPRGARAILAAGSIIQDHGDHDAALVKYRVAAVVEPHCPQLWNNIGMAFFGKQARRYIAAISCLSRALYLAPFEWLTAHNLGLAYLAAGQAASAFQHLSAAVNLKPDFAPSYMLLAVALERLQDPDNARAACERALQLDPREPLVHLNCAVMLHNQGDGAGAAARLAAFRELSAEPEEAARLAADPEVEEAAAALELALGQRG